MPRLPNLDPGLLQGVDEAFDAATAAWQQAQSALGEWIKDLRKSLGGSKDIAFVHVNKDSHLVEVPEGLAKNVPRDFVRAGNRKNFVRWEFHLAACLVTCVQSLIFV